MTRRQRTRRQRHRQQRRTRKQRLQKQKGGAEFVTRADEWAGRVRQHREQFVMEPDTVTPSTYVFDQLKVDSLAIPSRKKLQDNLSEREENFELNMEIYKSPDLRILGRALQTTLGPVFEMNPTSTYTPSNFTEMIQSAISPERIEQNSDMLTMMTAVEKALRQAAGDRSTTFNSIEQVNDRAYPLYIWYLVMNMPEEEEVPILMEQPTIPAPQVPSETTE
jgi:hypothetical protein